MSESWPTEHTDALRAGVAEGLSASQISAKIMAEFKVYYSRNSVIGKVNRLKLQLKGSFGSAASMNSKQGGLGYRAPAVKRVPANPVGQPRTFKSFGFEPVKFGAPTSPVPLPPRPVVEIEEAPGLCTIHDLQDRHCKWVIGATYCGAQKTRGSYCTKHADIAYRPQASSKLSPTEYARSLRRYVS